MLLSHRPNRPFYCLDYEVSIAHLIQERAGPRHAARIPKTQKRQWSLSATRTSRRRASSTAAPAMTPRPTHDGRSARDPVPALAQSISAPSLTRRIWACALSRSCSPFDRRRHPRLYCRHLPQHKRRGHHLRPWLPYPRLAYAVKALSHLHPPGSRFVRGRAQHRRSALWRKFTQSLQGEPTLASPPQC
jgi:hypothetical protein